MSYRVLVVDDEEPIRMLFADLLKKEKCSAVFVSSGEEAIAAIERNNFDIVLLDIKLPGISGLDTLQKLKEKKPDLIVIMITGFGYNEELIAKSKELGCSGYIGKDVPISQMMSNFRLFAQRAKDRTKK